MDAHPLWIEAIGLAAAFLTTSSFVPQAIKIWRSRSARDVSFVMYAMMSAGTALWLLYGLLLSSLALILANGTAFLLVTSVLVLKWRDRSSANASANGNRARSWARAAAPPSAE